MNWNDLSKKLTGLLIHYGVMNIVSNVIRKTTPLETNVFNRLTIHLAGFAVSSMISDKTTEYLNAEIDKLLVKEKTDVS